MSFEERLRRERLLRHLSQKDLAEGLGISSKSISRWEQGQAIPQGYARLQLCRFFHLRPEDLFAEIENQLPPSRIWNVPYPRNPFFTGREELLDSLHEQLNQEHAMTLTQSLAISGLGGIGKTQIALEYAYQYRQNYHFIFWTNVATHETLLTDIVALADLLQLPQRNEQDQSKILQAVKSWFATNEEWLWILDNADDVTMVNDILPTERPGHLLLTSRAQAWGSLAKRIEVETMGLAEGTLFLLRRAKLLAPNAFLDAVDEKELAAAEAIVLAVDFLPLALDQVGAYIEEIGCSLSAYLELYQIHRKELLQRRGHLRTDHPEPVATTWSLSFQKVEQANPSAADLLRLCAFLEPDAIPEELISKGSVYFSDALRCTVIDPFLLNEAIEELRKFSLIQRSPETQTLRIHRLVQAVLTDTLSAEEQYQQVEQVVHAVNNVFPEQVEASTWSLCRRYLSHAQMCSVSIQAHALVSEEAASLLLRTATYLQVYALYEQAEPLYLLALHIQEQIMGLEHPTTASCLNKLAFLYWHQSKHQQAEPLYQRALAIYEQHLGTDHPETAKCLNNLVILYGQQGKYEQAEFLCQQALSIREQHLGTDHPDTAMSLNNLMILYAQQGKYEQAEPLCQQALLIREQHLGTDHPDTAMSLNNLANLYCLQGKHEQAEPLYLRALSIYEHHLGIDHPSTAYILHGLAVLYQHQSKYEQAEPLYLRALAIYEQYLKPDHPDTAESLHGLANLYRTQELYKLAEPLYQRSLHIREQELGQQHPETAETLHDFAIFREMQGRRHEAVSLYQRALIIREHTFGPEHPKTNETLERLQNLSADSHTIITNITPSED